MHSYIAQSKLRGGLLVATMSFLSIIALSINAPAVQASYSGGNTPIDQHGWQRFWSESRDVRYKRYDENFERGKAVYSGAGPHKEFSYCVRGGGEAPRLTPLNRRSVRDLRGQTVGEFIRVLYDCKAPDKHVLTQLKAKDAGAVVYYLNSRYRLRLKKGDVGAASDDSIDPRALASIMQQVPFR